MANVFQPPLNSGSTASASLTGGHMGTVATTIKSNPGTPVQIALIAGSQISLQTAKGNITLSAPKSKLPIFPEQSYVAQLKTHPQETILEISHRYQQQQLNLTAGQSQQVIQQISQNPVLRESNLPLKGKVVAVQNSQIQISISGKTVVLPVPDSSVFKVGQWLALDLSAGQNTLSINQNSATKVPNELATALVEAGLKSGKVIQLNRHLLEGNIGAKELQTTTASSPLQLLQKGQQNILLSALPKDPLLKLVVPSEYLKQLNSLDIKSSLLQQGQQLTSPQGNRHSQDVLNNRSGQLLDNPTISKSDILRSQATHPKPPQNNPVDTPPLNESKAPESKPINSLIKHYQTQLGAEQSKQITQILNQLASVASKHEQPKMSLPEVSNLIQQLVQQVQEKTGAVGRLRDQLQAMAKELNTSSKVDPVIKTAISETISKVLPDSPQLSNIEPNHIKQLLQINALPLSTPAITAISSQSGFVAGLINLLQVALAARQQRSQPKTIEAILQHFVASAGGVTSEKKAESHQKTSKELGKLEQKLGLLKLSTDALEELAHSKLKNIERRLQGQESMHLILPFTGENNKPVAELRIKRELHEEEQRDKEKPQAQIWHLTMKLAIGELGEILCKSSLSGQTLDVDFFTSTDRLKDLVFNFAPVLKKRFEILGIEMTMGRCERGEIPESLAERPYQLFQAKA